MRVFSETAHSSQTKLIGQSLPIREQGIGYSSLTPDPLGAWGAPGVKIQISPNQKTSLTKVIRHDKGLIKISPAPPEELGKPAKRVFVAPPEGQTNFYHPFIMPDNFC